MKVGVIMGSISDWDVMSDAAATLAQFGVEFEKRVVSACLLYTSDAADE